MAFERLHFRVSTTVPVSAATPLSVPLRLPSWGAVTKTRGPFGADHGSDRSQPMPFLFAQLSESVRAAQTRALLPRTGADRLQGRRLA